MEHDVEVLFKSLDTAAEWDEKASAFTISPKFYRGERHALLSSIVVKVKGKKIGEFNLRLNGKTGGLSLVDRTKIVDPPIATTKKGAEESKGAVPANTPVSK